MNNEAKSTTLTIRQLHQALGHGQISRGALYEAIKRGDIPHLRLGGRILVPRAWLDRQLSGK
jgi:excisionase family DNA binding protein